MGCNATPLPEPPFADLDVAKIQGRLVSADTIEIEGEAGAIATPNVMLRISRPEGSSATTAPDEQDVLVDDTGGFPSIQLGYDSSDPRYFIERLTDTEDEFIGAVHAEDASDHVDFRESHDYDDSDEDGSPDEIDCDSEDSSHHGSRCDDDGGDGDGGDDDIADDSSDSEDTSSDDGSSADDASGSDESSGDSSSGDASDGDGASGSDDGT